MVGFSNDMWAILELMGIFCQGGNYCVCKRSQLIMTVDYISLPVATKKWQDNRDGGPKSVSA